MKLPKITLLLAGLLLSACGQESDNSADAITENNALAAENTYVLLGEDLQQLKDDFNDNEGRVRLMFLSGPTCGICLRGMADLNDAFIAESRNDDRLVTFVVHVPTLGAKEEHVADTIPLLNGPRVHHYWEDTGIIGRHYSDVMEVDIYVWDFWAIYGPDARWEGTLPPKPDYYEHQLGVSSRKFRTFPRELMLDAERFASKAEEFIDQVDASRFANGGDMQFSEGELQGDGTFIPVVAQPRNVAVSQHIRMRGGYKNLKRIESVEMHGHLEANGRSYGLNVSTVRPNEIARRVSADGTESTAQKMIDGTVRIDSQSDRGLPPAFESTLLGTFEFDGRLVEWPKKGHQVSMSGMQKIDDVLAWKLELQQSSGHRWHLFVDSHTGDIVKADMLNDDDRLAYSISRSNFDEVSGIRFPYRIEYLDAEGRLLGVDVIDTIEIIQESSGLSDVPVTH